ncbi:MAG: hypothetical protein QHJ73_19965 [Armatimonadota bacterium]|nr:hypothetical protein [Armatimonadota bacterium]
MAAAQQRYHSRWRRYATLWELQQEGLLAGDAISGPPSPRYGYAILSQSPPTRATFRVTATLSDGSALCVDQTGRIAPP